jgi:xanthine dehydrogenase accessory factor
MSAEAIALPAWMDALQAALAGDGRAALVVVAQVAGSVPRESGAAMVVTATTLHGSIGGGHLEFEALKLAREALARPAPSTSLARFPLAARVGQCCGGVATLVFATLDAGARGWLDAARACGRSGAPFASIARVGDGEAAQRRLLVSADDARGTLGDIALDSAAVAFARTRLATGTTGTLVMPLPGGSEGSLVVQIERPDPFPVLVFGNGHVGRALTQVLGVLPAQVRWIDEREQDFPASPPGNVEIVATDVPEAELRAAPAGSFVVITTHSHALDFALVEAALARDDFRYVGMIGSRAKRAQLVRTLAARGVDEARIASVVCPIGAALPGVHGKAPGMIAVAVAAELLAAKAAHQAPRSTLSLASPSR